MRRRRWQEWKGLKKEPKGARHRVAWGTSSDVWQNGRAVVGGRYRSRGGVL